jgi:hypothetical protein
LGATVSDRAAAIEYAIFGALCAAKIETGPQGARRMYRIQERIGVWDDAAVARALRRLMRRGWVRQLPSDDFGYVYYEIVPRPGLPPGPGGEEGAPGGVDANPAGARPAES